MILFFVFIGIVHSLCVSTFSQAGCYLYSGNQASISGTCVPFAGFWITTSGAGIVVFSDAACLFFWTSVSMNTCAIAGPPYWYVEPVCGISYASVAKTVSVHFRPGCYDPVQLLPITCATEVNNGGRVLRLHCPSSRWVIFSETPAILNPYGSCQTALNNIVSYLVSDAYNTTPSFCLTAHSNAFCSNASYTSQVSSCTCVQTPVNDFGITCVNETTKIYASGSNCIGSFTATVPWSSCSVLPNSTSLSNTNSCPSIPICLLLYTNSSYSTPSGYGLPLDCNCRTFFGVNIRSDCVQGRIHLSPAGSNCSQVVTFASFNWSATNSFHASLGYFRISRGNCSACASFFVNPAVVDSQASLTCDVEFSGLTLSCSNNTVADTLGTSIVPGRAFPLVDLAFVSYGSCPTPWNYNNQFCFQRYGGDNLCTSPSSYVDLFSCQNTVRENYCFNINCAAGTFHLSTNLTSCYPANAQSIHELEKCSFNPLLNQYVKMSSSECLPIGAGLASFCVAEYTTNTGICSGVYRYHAERGCAFSEYDNAFPGVFIYGDVPPGGPYCAQFGAARVISSSTTLSSFFYAPPICIPSLNGHDIAVRAAPCPTCTRLYVSALPNGCTGTFVNGVTNQFRSDQNAIQQYFPGFVGCFIVDCNTNSIRRGFSPTCSDAIFLATLQPFCQEFPWAFGNFWFGANLASCNVPCANAIPMVNYSVVKLGPGSGTVTGPGINCGFDCSGSVPESTIVNLTAIPDAGSTLVFITCPQTITFPGAECQVYFDLLPAPAPAPEPLPNPAPLPSPEPLPNPAPLPSPEPLPNPAPSPEPAPLPSPEPAPLPNPEPAPLPSPEPVPSPLPAPLPSPEPAPSPTPTPTPSPSPTPSPTPTPPGCVDCVHPASYWYFNYVEFCNINHASYNGTICKTHNLDNQTVLSPVYYLGANATGQNWLAAYQVYVSVWTSFLGSICNNTEEQFFGFDYDCVLFLRIALQSAYPNSPLHPFPFCTELFPQFSEAINIVDVVQCITDLDAFIIQHACIGETLAVASGGRLDFF